MSTATATCDVTLLTTAEYIPPPAEHDWYKQQVHLEEKLIADALVTRGFTCARANWSDDSFDWSSTRLAVFRSTWDYFNRLAEFTAWLERASATTVLVNDPELVRWNLDKRYMADLEAAGVAVVPSRFFESGPAPDLAACAAEMGWDEVVVKPVVSGAGRLTVRAAGGAQIGGLQPWFADCLSREPMLMQPFQSGILLHGELSLIMIAGKFTHAVRKTARPGEFRVQDDHGGVVHHAEASAEEIAAAEAAVAACPVAPVYARVDFVGTANGPRLMELELIEPELFFRFNPAAAEKFADALVRKMKSDA